MKQNDNSVHTFHTISDLHKALGFPKPLHPLLSLVNYADITTPPDELPRTLLLNFYKISYKQHLSGKVKYGQNYYDFDEGGLSFVSPNQVISGSEEEKDYAGHTLLIHPDFIRNYPLAARIKSFGFFSYAANEALFLSDKEKQVILGVFESIRSELNTTIDDFSQDVIIAHLEVLLNYSNRFYKRQFITRKAVNHELLTRMEQVLHTYFDNEEPLNKGILTVEYLAAHLHLSPRYLSDMLRSLTGQNAQQHIHSKLIDKAKEILSTTELTVSEIAYRLGFEHPQSFSKLFKAKANVSPLEYRRSFN